MIGNAHPAPEIGVIVFVRGLQRTEGDVEYLPVATQGHRLSALLLFECSAIIGVGHVRTPRFVVVTRELPTSLYLQSGRLADPTGSRRYHENHARENIISVQ